MSPLKVTARWVHVAVGMTGPVRVTVPSVPREVVIWKPILPEPSFTVSIMYFSISLPKSKTRCHAFPPFQ